MPCGREKSFCLATNWSSVEKINGWLTLVSGPLHLPLPSVLAFGTLCILSVYFQLSRKLMAYPCRGRGCEHLHCFDAAAFLLTNMRRRQWTCPLCRRVLAFSDLLIDGFVFRFDLVFCVFVFWCFLGVVFCDGESLTVYSPVIGEI